MYVNTVGCLLTQLIQIDHVHKQLMLLVWECRVYQMRFPNLCDHSTSNTSITKSNTHLLVINLAWPNICVCQGWGIDRSFDFKLFCIFDCHMQTHYSLFTHTCRWWAPSTTSCGIFRSTCSHSYTPRCFTTPFSRYFIIYHLLYSGKFSRHIIFAVFADSSRIAKIKLLETFRLNFPGVRGIVWKQKDSYSTFAVLCGRQE